MKFAGPDLDPYRVQMRVVPVAPGIVAHRPDHWWSRTWQVEWDGCEWAARGYTRPGALRRARRWHRKGGRPGWQIAAHRWVRRNITQRGG